MKSGIRVFVWAGIWFLCAGSSPAQVERAAAQERATWRFEFDNDIFFHSDNNFTSGLSLQRHSTAARDWESASDVPKLFRRLGRLIPTLHGREAAHRFGLAVGQVIQTPEDTSRKELIETDVPYAGALTLQASWYTYSDRSFRGFEITLGVVGPPSLAGQAQRAVHKMLHCTVPQGWDNQLDTEPLLNLSYVRKEKIWHGGEARGLSADLAAGGGLTLGNMFTQASAAIELRTGLNMPGGFHYIPDPIGFSVHHMAALRPARPQRASFYASLALRGTALAHSIFLDGNTFRESHHVARKHVIGQLVGGLHLEHRQWGVRFFVLASSAVVDIRRAPAAEEKELVGTINLEWRI